MERWSYKPEVEGLSPSLGTTLETRATKRDAEKGRRGDAEKETFVVTVRGRPRVPASACLRVSPHPSRFTHSRGVTHSGRTVTAGTVEFEEARRPHAPSKFEEAV